MIILFNITARQLEFAVLLFYRHKINGNKNKIQNLFLGNFSSYITIIYTPSGTYCINQVII